LTGSRQRHLTTFKFFSRRCLLLRDHLHWLLARERISFKLCLLVYKAIHGLAPCYVNEMCVPVSTVPNLSALRSTARGDLVVPRTRQQLGNRAFVWLVRSPGTVYHWTFVRCLCSDSCHVTADYKLSIWVMIRFSVWSAGGYAHVLVRLSVVIVTLTHHSK